tara:strand:+ start:1895 stop:2032 length:138 start_codon:yes stop_codon:yes gene_type:complete
MDKQELLDLLRICNADTTAIEAVELAYDIGYAAGLVAAAGRREDD